MTDPADAQKTDGAETPAPEATGPQTSDRIAPDVAISLLNFLRTRLSIKATLAYLAIGWIGLQFSSVVLVDWPHYPLFKAIYLVVYLSGVFIFLSGAYLVIAGKHRLRSVALFALVLTSIGTGTGVGILLYRHFNPPQPKTSSEQAADAPSSNDDNADGPTPPIDPPRSPSMNAGLLVDGRETTRQTAPRPSDTTRTGPEAENTDRPSIAAPPQTASVDPVDAKLEELIQIFGAGEERTIDASRPVEFLAGFDRPIRIRVGPFSSGFLINFLNNTNLRQSRQRMEMRNRGDRATDRLTIPTGCGDFVYDFEATLMATNPAQVHVVVRLDRAAARQTVSAATKSGRCL